MGAVGIEAHVERLVALEREPAPRLVELVRRHPEVEQDRLGGGDVAAPGHLAHVAEARAHQPDPLAVGGEALAGPPEGLGVDVQPQQADARARLLEERLRVSAHPHRPVDHPALPAWPQEERDLVHEDRDVNC